MRIIVTITKSESGYTVNGQNLGEDYIEAHRIMNRLRKRATENRLELQEQRKGQKPCGTQYK